MLFWTTRRMFSKNSKFFLNIFLKSFCWPLVGTFIKMKLASNFQNTTNAFRGALSFVKNLLQFCAKVGAFIFFTLSERREGEKRKCEVYDSNVRIFKKKYLQFGHLVHTFSPKYWFKKKIEFGTPGVILEHIPETLLHFLINIRIR